MTSEQVNLYRLFNAVNQALKQNQVSLNEADSYNHDHGDNMVKNFKVITKALKQKTSASPTDQLAYASQVLGRSSKSGSAQMYAQGLAQAATKLQGQPAVTSKNAMDLVQALLGGGQQPGPAPTQPGSGDMMGQLIGSLMGGGLPTDQPTPSSENPSGDVLGGLMGALLGGESAPTQSQQATQPPDALGGLMGALMGGSSGETPSYTSSAGQTGTSGGQQPDMLGGLMGELLGGGASETPVAPPSTGSQGGGFNLNTLLTGAMAYMQASQQGAAPLEALIQAVLAGSQMNSTPHHAQSGQLVAGTLINTLGTLLGGK